MVAVSYSADKWEYLVCKYEVTVYQVYNLDVFLTGDENATDGMKESVIEIFKSYDKNYKKYDTNYIKDSSKDGFAIRNTSLNKALEKIGDDGWELVQVIQLINDVSELEYDGRSAFKYDEGTKIDRETEYYFKRKLDE